MCLNMNISEFKNISEGLKVTLNLTQIIVKIFITIEYFMHVTD